MQILADMSSVDFFHIHDIHSSDVLFLTLLVVVSVDEIRSTSCPSTVLLVMSGLAPTTWPQLSWYDVGCAIVVGLCLLNQRYQMDLTRQTDGVKNMKQW